MFNLSVVPALCLVVMMLLSQGEKPSRYQQKKQPESLSSYKLIDIKQANYDQDYQTISSYIKKKFTKVSDEDVDKISTKLVEYGKEHDLDPKFAAALIARESAFQKDAVSVTGAKGLGQIKDFNFNDLDIKDPYAIDQNVSGTVQYLKKMIKKWKENPEKKPVDKSVAQDSDSEKTSDIKLALASYYKGFTAVKNEGVDPKTEAYVDDIIDYYQEIIDSQVEDNTLSK